MKCHRLKTWPEYFELVRTHKKEFEIRENDRDFQVGDILVLEEWIPDTPQKGCKTGKYTDRKNIKVVTCIVANFWGLAANFVAMGLRDATKDDILLLHKPAILAKFPMATFDEERAP